MIINYLNRHSKSIAWSLYLLFCSQCVFAGDAGRRAPLPVLHAADRSGIYAGPMFPAAPVLGLPALHKVGGMLPLADAGKHSAKKTFGGGPTQPEMQAFQSVNANNMVDLFSGDFSYNIPLMDVGGYPVNISYRSGISMDQEASWVGLGWNVNPGTIMRNLRGIPDDFNGNDSIRKVQGVREHKTVGVTGGGGGDVEIAGVPLNLNLGVNLGIFHNNYKGWGVETGVNASINAGGGSKGGLTGGLGLSVKNNSQDGITLTPSLSVDMEQKSADEKSSTTSSFSTSLPYNSRSGDRKSVV